MKKILTIASVIAAGAGTMYETPSFGLTLPDLGGGTVTFCMKISDCQKSNSKYCCLTGETSTEYTCPTGWTLNSTNKTCSRADTTGSDETGAYKTSYGTCDATENTYNCYRGSMTSEGSTCMMVIS